MGIFDELKVEITEIVEHDSTKYKNSKFWMEWVLGNTKNHCWNCLKNEHKIFEVIDAAISTLKNKDKPPLHLGCLCYFRWLKSVAVGFATNLRENGADYWLYHFKCLPVNYITKETAISYGWKAHLGNLNDVLPGKIIGGNIYGNRDGKLPSAPGRIWYECDINYEFGFRGQERLIYSNDGLIFKTVDHYNSFIVIE